jgi:hypothetical protein
VAEWMEWDAWLASRGLRIVDWEPFVDLEYLGWSLERPPAGCWDDEPDPLLADPEFAELVPVREAVAELVAAWEAKQHRTPSPPGVRKALQESRELTELVHAVIVRTRQPREVAALLGTRVQAITDAFHHHELLPPLGRGWRAGRG